MFASGINPILLFGRYFSEAKKKERSDATAFALATTSSTLRPSVRMVLLKDFNEQGFVFYTNLLSKKGRELRHNSYASMCFYWDSLGIQIRIAGSVKQVSDQEADNYFATRDRKTKLGAWASKQSYPLKDMSGLIKKFNSLNIMCLKKRLQNKLPPIFSYPPIAFLINLSGSSLSETIIRAMSSFTKYLPICSA